LIWHERWEIVKENFFAIIIKFHFSEHSYNVKTNAMHQVLQSVLKDREANGAHNYPQLILKLLKMSCGCLLQMHF